MSTRLKNDASLSPTLSKGEGSTVRSGKMSLFFILCSTLYFVLCTSSCKINYSFKGASIPPEAKTVSVKYFENFAPLASPVLSQAFSEALRDIFTTQTRLTLTNTTADLNFEGSITGYAVNPINIQSSEQAAQNRLTITVNVKYTNRLDEKKNFESSFSRYADYPSTQSLSSAETELIREINKQLVQDIYNKAFNNW